VRDSFVRMDVQEEGGAFLREFWRKWRIRERRGKTRDVLVEIFVWMDLAILETMEYAGRRMNTYFLGRRTVGLAVCAMRVMLDTIVRFGLVRGVMIP